jgi:putative hydroxymethylpyrimidine transport system substrate-binding protein
VACVLCAVLAGCGGSSTSSKPAPEVTLALDFTPNAVHAPIYAAVREGFDRAAGVRLRIRAPGASPDSLKDVLSGAADMGILDIHDLGLAAVKGKDVVAVAALVERPLAAIVTSADVRRPRDLEGRRVGVSGLPSDPAVLDAVMRDDGGDYRKADLVTIGFTAVQSLISGRISGVPVFWNAEGVALRRRGVRIHEFRVDDYGAPRYPEVVLMTSRRELTEHRDRLERALQAIEDGRRDVLARPGAAAQEIAKVAETSDVALVRAQLDAVDGAFAPGLKLDRGVLERWARFDARIGIVDRPPDVARAFDFSMAP